MSLPGLAVRRTAQRVRLRVDASRCGGKGVCVRVAPELFGLDRFGYAYVRDGAQERVDADASARILAREALVRCPDGAIRLDPIDDARPAPPPLEAENGHRESPGPRLLVGEAETLDAWLAGAAPGAVDDLLSEVDRAGLVGQGGGRFPVAAKWRAALGGGAVTVVVNAAEREPGTIKDRVLLSSRPFAVLDGVARTAAAVGADRAVVAIDEEQGSLVELVRTAIAGAETAGLLGGLAVTVATVPARYVAGEETALLAALAGQAALPRARPPHPTERGLAGRPTVVHNVETFVQVALVARHGAAWFRAAGTGREPGTGVFSVGTFGGPVEVHEAALGTPVRELLEAAGARDVAAIVVGGWSGGIVRPDQADVALSHAGLAAVGAALGTKAIAVVPTTQCPVSVVQRIVTHFAAESAGQCPPCVQGLPFVAGVLARLARSQATDDDVEALHSFLATLPGRGACALPDGAVRMTRSLFRNFADAVERHRAAVCPICQEDLG